MGGGGEGTGGGRRGHMFFRRNRRGSVVAERMFGGGATVSNCKLTANKGGIARVLQSLLGESGKSYSDTTKIVRSTPPPPRDDKV